MKNKHIFIAIALSFSTIAHTKDTILTLFLNKYGLPAHISQALQKIKKSYGTDKALPGYFLKGQDHERLINAIRLERFIKDNNLTNIAVAKKFIDCTDENKGCRIIVEKITSADKGRVLTLEDTRQLAMLAEKTGFSDWGMDFDNVIINKKDNKLTLIDTENMSFAMWESFEDVPSRHPLHTLASLYQNKRFMNAEARKWLTERINTLLTECMKNEEECKKQIVMPLCFNSTLDPEDFNLEEIKEAIEKRNTAATSKN